ncbi:hypothetical protein AAAC13_25935 [Pseudomonas aeruginosa]
MFYDYLTVEQVFPYQLPQVGDTGICYYDRRTGEQLRDTSPSFKVEGSHSTSIRVRVDGNKLRVEGNPSAVNRLDNLHGFQSIAECVAVYNDILHEIKDDKGNRLPSFTACTDWGHLQTEDGSKTRMIGNGARLRRVDSTTNRTVGKGNELAYIRALSTQRVGYKNGHLYEDGWTCDWQARDHYYKAYGKAQAIRKFLFPKCKRNFGEDSPNSATCSTWPRTAISRASCAWNRNSRVSIWPVSGWSGGGFLMKAALRRSMGSF